MPDHKKLLCDLPLMFIAEVKLGECRLNGPWTEPARQNMQRVLRAVGVYEPREVDVVAEALYSERHFRDSRWEFRLYAVGDRAETLERDLPGVVTLTWGEVFAFIHKRFTDYRRVKKQHEQWDETGRLLFQVAAAERDRDQFVEVARQMLT